MQILFEALAMQINEDFKHFLFGCFTSCPNKTSYETPFLYQYKLYSNNLVIFISI